MQCKKRFDLGACGDTVAEYFGPQKLYVVCRDAALLGQPGNRRCKDKLAHQPSPFLQPSRTMGDPLGVGGRWSKLSIAFCNAKTAQGRDESQSIGGCCSTRQ
jgi:hypothetical protein